MTSIELSYIDYNFNDNILAITHTEKSEYSRIEIANILGQTSQDLAIPLQTHSANVLYIDKPGEVENCDGLITHESNVVLSLQTADCIPVFLHDEVTGLRGLIHAGWRGIVSGIVKNAIELMVAHQSKVEDIKVVLGPSICKNCFEVGSEVAVKFETKYKNKGLKGKWHVDLHGQVKCQLLDLGIFLLNIKSSHICSYENYDYCSYRRDGAAAGRMFSFMGVKNRSN
jgi:YfiH family protein